MNPITSILVPTDFSPCSRAALGHAAELAARFGATIGVLHVWEATPMRWSDSELPSLPEFAHTRAGDLMRRHLDELERRGVDAHGRLAIGEPWRTIVEVAESGSYDLIAMGTYGISGLAHMLLRTVPERVARRAPCPVLIIRVPEPVELASAMPSSLEDTRLD